MLGTYFINPERVEKVKSNSAAQEVGGEKLNSVFLVQQSTICLAF